MDTGALLIFLGLAIIVVVGIRKSMQSNDPLEDFEPAVDDLPESASSAFTPDTLPPRPRLEQVLIEGTKLYYAVPEGPLVGLILLFHGRNGSGNSWFRLIENQRFVRIAVGAGYAVASLDSTDRRERVWNLRPQNNLDYRHVQATMAFLRERDVLAPQTPTFALGHSYGAAFASRLGLGLDLKAVALANGPRVDPAMAKRRMPPTLFIGGVNDFTVPLQDVEENYRLVLARGLDTALHINRPSPVTPERFVRIPGVGPAMAEEMYTSLKRTRILDANDLQVLAPKQSGWERAMPRGSLASQYEVESQLDECFGGHRFTSEFSQEILDFFAKYR